MKDYDGQEEQDYLRSVQRQVERARARQRPSIWQSVATFGTVGWMVALPAVGGAFLGRWLDGAVSLKPLSWTLCLLLLGLGLGCASAWQYVERALTR